MWETAAKLKSPENLASFKLHLVLYFFLGISPPFEELDYAISWLFRVYLKLYLKSGRKIEIYFETPTAEILASHYLDILHRKAAADEEINVAIIQLTNLHLPKYCCFSTVTRTLSCTFQV
jgi:hypothetical protein